MNLDKQARYWYAYIYEQQENQTDDVELMLPVIGKPPLKVLEVCCGGGRIAIALARAGHMVTGFDIDAFALERLALRAKGMENIAFFRADAIRGDWGEGFDVVVMGGNLLLNIESDMEYRAAQQLLISKAAASLREGGHLYLDFNCNERFDSYKNDDERVIFEGMDDRGTFGRYVIYDEAGDGAARTWRAQKAIEITAADGREHAIRWESGKYFPRFGEAQRWIENAGLCVERAYGDHRGAPRDEDSSWGIIWAKKL